MSNEIKIEGKWYFELEPTDKNQAFNPPEPALLWDDGTQDVEDIYFVTKKGESSHPFKTGRSVSYKHCALLSSEHEKKSRRCTTLELAKWCDQNGFWINAEGVAVTKTSFFYETRNDECDGNLISICTWDGEPMEPTAKNMGLEE